MTPTAMAPNPIPAPRPANFPDWEREVADVDVEIDPDKVLEVGFIRVLETGLHVPLFSKRKKRSLRAQHSSELKSPQHQELSVSHNDNSAFDPDFDSYSS